MRTRLRAIIQEGLEGFASGRFQIRAEVKRFFESHTGFPKDSRGQVRNQYVTDILTKPIYAGYVEAPQWDVPLRKGRHEGLISFETFEKIQRHLTEDARVPARVDINEDFPLRGAVACGCCGKPLTACWATQQDREEARLFTTALRRAVSVGPRSFAAMSSKASSRRCLLS